MGALGEQTTAASGGPPAGNHVMVAGLAAVTDNVTSGDGGTTLDSAPTWTMFAPGVRSGILTAEPTTIGKKGWMLGRSDGTVQPVSAVVAGTWTLSVVVVPPTTSSANTAVGVRVYQVSADQVSSTLITLATPTGGTSGANGWQYAPAKTASLGGSLTFTSTMPSVGAVSLASGTKYLYVELVLKFNNEEAVSPTYALTSFTLTTPAFSYTGAYPVTVTGTPANRKAVTVAGPKAATVTGTPANVKAVTVAGSKAVSVTGTPVNVKQVTPGSKSVTVTGTPANRKAVTVGSKSVTATGTPANVKQVTPGLKAVTVTGTPANVKAVTPIPKAVTATGTPTNRKAVTVGPKTVTVTGSTALARTIAAARAFAVTATGTMGFQRLIILARSYSTSATAVTSARLDIPQVALNRIIAANPDYPLTTPTKAIAGVTRNAAGAVLGGCTVKLVRQSDNVTVATAVSHATLGTYSFTRDAADPNTYRVVANLAGAPEVHGVTDTLTPV